LSTFWLNPEILKLDIYSGKNGSFTLYEDDAVTEKYKTKNENRTTDIIYTNSDYSVIIKAVKGTYTNAPENRAYQICIYGIAKLNKVEVNGKPLKLFKEEKQMVEQGNSIFWSEDMKTLHIYTGPHSIHKDVIVKAL
jgi:hypothetical protein